MNGSLVETEGSKSAEGIRGGGQEAPCVPPPRSVRTGLSDPLTRASQRPNQRRSRSRATCSTQTPGARCPLVREMYLSISVFEHFGGANARRSQVERAPPRRRAARSPGGSARLFRAGELVRARGQLAPPPPPRRPRPSRPHRETSARSRPPATSRPRGPRRSPSAPAPPATAMPTAASARARFRRRFLLRDAAPGRISTHPPRITT